MLLWHDRIRKDSALFINSKIDAFCSSAIQCSVLQLHNVSTKTLKWLESKLSWMQTEKQLFRWLWDHLIRVPSPYRTSSISSTPKASWRPDGTHVAGIIHISWASLPSIHRRSRCSRSPVTAQTTCTKSPGSRCEWWLIKIIWPLLLLPLVTKQPHRRCSCGKT